MAERGGGFLVLKLRLVVLDRNGVLANLLSTYHVVVGMPVVQPDQLGDNDTASEPT